MRRISTFVMALAAGTLAFGALAEARPLHHRHVRHGYSVRVAHATPEITVRKRSFLDPGNVVPVGSENHYMDQGTIYIQTPSPTYRREEFGEETLLPKPGDLPGFTRYAPW
jgi:hypothetical protein